VSVAPTRESTDAAPERGDLLSDDGLYKLIGAGMIAGTPILFIVAVVISYLSGVGVGNALAIAVIPAMFGGVTFGGFVVLMRHLRREDQADAAARATRRALTIAIRDAGATTATAPAAA
jgi:hypothetical protein